MFSCCDPTQASVNGASRNVPYFGECLPDCEETLARQLLRAAAQAFSKYGMPGNRALTAREARFIVGVHRMGFRTRTAEWRQLWQAAT
jgi:hypothetical protein